MVASPARSSPFGHSERGGSICLALLHSKGLLKASQELQSCTEKAQMQPLSQRHGGDDK